MPPEMAARWTGESVPLTAAALEGAALVIDALFGAGLNRPLEGAARDVVAALGGAPVIAIDVPSRSGGRQPARRSGSRRRHWRCGQEADAHRVTFFRKKPGHLLLRCGPRAVRRGDRGRYRHCPSRSGADRSLFENSPALWDYPWPKLEGHKYARGHCVVVSGPAHATGAARLAARGALRIGAGLVERRSSLDRMRSRSMPRT